MTSLIVNSAEDLAALEGTVQYTEFLTLLEGSLWRVERDETAQTFVAIEDNSTIERYGLTREDFPNAQPPALPEWTPLPPVVHACSPWQIRKALNDLGLRQAVEDAVSASTDATLKDGWAYATEFRSDDSFVIAMGASLGKTPEETAELIEFAKGL